jgi:uncharacterized caspase-like protein
MANRALLIGINRYPDPRNTLQGCIKDALAVKQLLQDYYGFSDEDIRELHDEQATLANVRSGLDWLVTDTAVGDCLIFYESSHGYHYVKDGTMVQVLCLYDGFLEDHELSERTQVLPPGTLTVILDACFSGGMDKLFFMDDRVQAVRAKVFQPDLKRARQDAQALQTATQFKSFGYLPSREAGLVAKAFTRIEDVPLAKANLDLEINALLLSACSVDETAADGSPATNGNSAFTFSLIQSHQVGISNLEERDRAEQQLRDLRMQQTPQLEGAPPDLESQTFITLQPLDRKDVPMTTTPQIDMEAIAQQIANQIRAMNGQKAYTPPPAPARSGDVNTTVQAIAQQIADQLRAPSGQKGFDGPPSYGDSLYWSDIINFLPVLTPTLQALADNKSFHAKAFAPGMLTLADPRHLGSKGWFSDLLVVVQEVGPTLIHTLSRGKDYKSSPGLAGVRPEHINDKDFWTDVVNIVVQLAPPLLDALQGNKDYKFGATAPDAPAISSAHINDKGWFDDVMHVVSVVAPYVISAVA